MKKNIAERMINEYLTYLTREERSLSTRKQYERELLRLFAYTGNRELTKELLIEYKEKLQTIYKPESVNTKLAALNSFFSFTGENELKVRMLKIQRKTYCAKEREISKNEYLRLVKAAKGRKNERLSLLMQTLCGTGIRVSELRFITAEAVECKEAVISLKGKNRVILIAGKLRKALKAYIEHEGIKSGPVFITRNGNSIDRSNIWKMMKGLGKAAGIDGKKIFPHNLRHLFARAFYELDKDIARLADILGHSNINTTRIYIISSGKEHQRRMEALGLIV